MVMPESRTRRGQDASLPAIVTVFGGDPAARLEEVHRARLLMSAEQRSPLPPFTDGWHGAMFSDDLAVGEVRTARVVGREIALFRGGDGVARALGAWCAHLGAHLGHGGRVVGNDIVCPFHDWRWSGEGRCVEVPYTKRIPANACMPAYEVRDRNGFLFVWVHARGAKPSWEIEVIPEIGAPDHRLVARRITPMRGHVQDLAENGVDLPHFRSLHKWSAKSIDWQVDGPSYTMVYDLEGMRHERDAGVDIQSKCEGTFTRSRFWGRFHGVTAHAMTQIDEGILLLQQLYYYRSDVPDDVALAAVDSSDTEWAADVPIWENKLYRERPVLTGDDGPVAKFRRWYAQFYSDPPPLESIGEERDERILHERGEGDVRIGAAS